MKITPVHKQGDKNNIANYRPVANLCAVTKIYERLILQKIHEIESKQLNLSCLTSFKLKCKNLFLNKLYHSTDNKRDDYFFN